ncbi:MAG TPA: SGNH/GDSL hydrolase family protein [Mycobacteriales bacterium]|nr:SGNH/GDSL hydrolase family protein [Mycobacteriales bacterium]
MLLRVLSARRRRFALITAGPLLAALLAGAGADPATAGPPADPASPAAPEWVTSWGGSAMSPSALVSGVQTLQNQTVRNVIYTSTGGDQLRIRVSNAFGDRAVRIGAATVARQLRDAGLDPATVHRLTFAGRPAITLARGGSAVSDPVRMRVPALANLAVSLYLPDFTGPATYHQGPQQTNYLAPGDATGSTGAAAFTTVGTWFFLDAVQVRGPARSAIIAFGDSITDGANGQVNANTRWPNYLARRLADRFGAAAPAVVDEGISGNRILNDSVCFGVNAPARLDRDVLSQPGARAVILLEGINDLGFSQTPNADCTAPNTEVSTDQLIAGYRRIIARVHAAGLKIYGGTLMPAEGFFYWSPAAEAKRQVVNTWIRTAHAFDGVIDFDRAVSYPGHPNLLDPKYDSGDHLHPNDGGYQAMANTIDLTQLTH